MLTDITNSLIETARNSAATETDLKAAAQSFFTRIRSASRDQANVALRTLSAHFDSGNPRRGAFLALVCGVLIENGCDPLAISSPLTAQLANLLNASAQLLDACTEISKTEKDGPSNEDFNAVRQRLAPSMQEQDAAWEALEVFWSPAIAVYSLCPEARSAAKPLREVALRISGSHEAGYWLQQMLNVLDDEPVLVIEPHTKLGVLGRISGVVDNFQLNVLLMDSFPRTGFWPKRRVSKTIANIARGIGPQKSQDTVMGTWNLYSWKAIESGMTLPPLDSAHCGDHWIWNEGTPADIPVFEGRRVVLLGPKSYLRTWQSQRVFANLPACFEIERKLAKNEVSIWLNRMIDAK